MPERQVELMSGRVYFFFDHRLEDGAVQFRHMMAIGETALAQHGFEFRKCPLQHALGKMVKAKLLEAGRINHIRLLVQRIEPGKCRGVFAGVQSQGYFPHSDFRIGYQQVHQRGFAHAGLADQYRRLTRHQRLQNCEGAGRICFGTDLVYRIYRGLGVFGEGAVVNESLRRISGRQAICLRCKTQINGSIATLILLSVRIEAIVVGKAG